VLSINVALGKLTLHTFLLLKVTVNLCNFQKQNSSLRYTDKANGLHIAGMLVKILVNRSKQYEKKKNWIDGVVEVKDPCKEGHSSSC
jgi:hypothetical protein